MTTLATPQLEQYISQQIVSGETVVFDEFIFANIPNLTADNLQNHLAIPSASHIVHRQVVSQTGVVNQNAVVYSVTIGSDIGDFDFNFIGLINKSKGLLGIAIYTDTVKKLKNKNGIQGNSLTRSILLEFSGAPQHTNITIPAETWQIDFTLRLNGLDEKIRLTNRDLYGRAIFFDEGFLIKRKSGNNFTITAGIAYVEGVRANITADESITLALPCSVYVDVVHHCTVTGAYQTAVKFLKTAKSDYLDTAGNQHYVQILADIDQNGNITDRRLLSPLLGIKPKDLDDSTESRADKTGHTHKLPLATLLKKGITKLFSGLDSDAEDMAATPKAIKALKSLIDAITRNLGNYIPNSKKSNAINSNSADTVATSLAAKTAYDKGVEAKTAADNAQRTANAKQSPATTLSGYGITDGAVAKSLTTENLNAVTAAGLYGQRANVNATSQRNYPNIKAGALQVIGSAYGVMQIYTTWDTKNVFVRNQQPDGWSDWVRVDGLDKIDKSGDTMTGPLEINAADSFVRLKRDGVNIGYVGIPNARTNNIALHSYIHNTQIELQADKVHLNKPLEVSNVLIKSGDWSKVELFNNANKRLILEVSPDSINSIGSIVYRNASYSNEALIGIPRKNGTLLLDSDGSTSGNANTYAKRDGSGDITARLLRSTYQDEERIVGAIAFRVNNGNDNYTRYCSNPKAVINWLNLKADVNRSNKSRTNTFPLQTGKSYSTVGSVTIYPDGRIIQIMHLKNIKPAWFSFEDTANAGDRHRTINIPLWTAMPNKIIDVSPKPIRSSSNASTYYTEAGEWISAWQIYGNDTNKSSVNINISRFRGANDEDMDLYVVVEGY